MGKPFKIKELLKSFVYAAKGIRALIGSERNVWIHCAAIILTTIAGFYFDITKGEWTAVVLCFGLVLAAEAFNTAIEKLVDLVSPEWNLPAGKIKDIAAGAVLICAIVAAIVGAIIFIPHLLN